VPVDGAPAQAVAAALAALAPLGDRAVADGPLGARTTYRVGGPAAVLAEVEHPDELALVAAAVAASGLEPLVVGRGSNLLVADAGYPGLAVVLCDGLAGIDVDEPSATVRAGGAALLPVVARRSVACGLAGMEWAVGVPGSVGGAVRMNAGGHGSDMDRVVVEAEVFDLRRGVRSVRTHDDLCFRFRGSAVAGSEVVVAATLRLRPGDRDTSERLLAEIVRWRRDHQPGGQNAGSVFVNPLPRSAGELIDGLGLKGLRHGSAQVSTKHANFIQADDGGRAGDVVALIDAVAQRVRDAHGVELRTEIRCVGFGRPVPAPAPGGAGPGGGGGEGR
jgi:UDP-N-acetylmuramate dehydrogenase